MPFKQSFKIKVFGRKQTVNVIVGLNGHNDIIPDNAFYIANMTTEEFNSLESVEEKRNFLQKSKFFESMYKASDKESLSLHLNKVYLFLN